MNLFLSPIHILIHVICSVPNDLRVFNGSRSCEDVVESIHNALMKVTFSMIWKIINQELNGSSSFHREHCLVYIIGYYFRIDTISRNGSELVASL